MIYPLLEWIVRLLDVPRINKPSILVDFTKLCTLLFENSCQIGKYDISKLILEILHTIEKD